MTMKSYKIRNGVQLTTLAYHPAAHIPKAVKFSACSLPLLRPVPGSYTALYGQDGKRFGLGDARAALQPAENFQTLDFWVVMQKPVFSELLTHDRLEQTELMRIHRLSTDVRYELATHWKQWLKDEGTYLGDMPDSFFSDPDKFVSPRPDLVARIFDLYPGINVVVHPAVTHFSKQPLTVATFRYPPVSGVEITGAECRNYEEIEVIL